MFFTEQMFDRADLEKITIGTSGLGKRQGADESLASALLASPFRQLDASNNYSGGRFWALLGGAIAAVCGSESRRSHPRIDPRGRWSAVVFEGSRPSNHRSTMVDYRLELVIIPVTDVDRVVAFYGTTLGWPVDHDQVVSPQVRFVQVTAPGSACSIAFGLGLLPADTSAVAGLQVVTDDADAAHADLTARGVDVAPVDDRTERVRR